MTEDHEFGPLEGPTPDHPSVVLKGQTFSAFDEALDTNPIPITETILASGSSFPDERTRKTMIDASFRQHDELRNQSARLNEVGRAFLQKSYMGEPMSLNGPIAQEAAHWVRQGTSHLDDQDRQVTYKNIRNIVALNPPAELATLEAFRQAGRDILARLDKFSSNHTFSVETLTASAEHIGPICADVFSSPVYRQLKLSIFDGLSIDGEERLEDVMAWRRDTSDARTAVYDKFGKAIELDSKFEEVLEEIKETMDILKVRAVKDFVQHVKNNVVLLFSNFETLLARVEELDVLLDGPVREKLRDGRTLPSTSYQMVEARLRAFTNLLRPIDLSFGDDFPPFLKTAVEAHASASMENLKRYATSRHFMDAHQAILAAMLAIAPKSST